jgi:hypothetical protein
MIHMFLSCSHWGLYETQERWVSTWTNDGTYSIKIIEK